MSEIDLKQLSRTELAQFLSDNRNNPEQFSAGLQELMNRDIWTTVEANTPAEIEAEIIQNAIASKKQNE